MRQTIESEKGFDQEQARECAHAFAASTGVGCAVSDVQGNLLYGVGYHCGICNICGTLRRLQPSGSAQIDCRSANLYGMAQAERFGGKYVYFCPMGLTCFASPVINDGESIALITAGPLLLVEAEEYIDFDLTERFPVTQQSRGEILEALKSVPYVSPKRVSKMSTMLFMSVGFLNNVAVCEQMLKAQASDTMQGQIGEFMYQLKQTDVPPQYPFDKERKLVQSIVDSDKAAAHKLLNELLGYIFFSCGLNFSIIKSRINELLVLISRAAIDGGADPTYIFDLNHTYMSQIQSFGSIEDLSLWLSEVINRFIDAVFCYPDVKHIDMIRKATQYIRQHYAAKLSLEEVARQVSLSPSYFSKLFKKETGVSFSAYLNKMRIEKSKQLLLSDGIRLVDISAMLGFEDQSYFSKVFKKATGISPYKYRESKGRAKP